MMTCSMIHCWFLEGKWDRYLLRKTSHLNGILWTILFADLLEMGLLTSYAALNYNYLHTHFFCGLHLPEDLTEYFSCEYSQKKSP